MVTSAVSIALIGTLLFKCAISAAINYEPIKITVNENFNSQPAQGFQESEYLEPDVIHHGANFYFKPQLNLPPSYIPPRIEDLISLIQQYHHSCTKDTSELVENEKLMEILKPFMYRSSEIPKENPLEIVLKNRNTLENIKIVEIIASELKEIPRKSLAMPIKITEDPKPVTPELLVVPEAPVLRPLSHNGIPFMRNKVKEDETGILKEPTDIFPTMLKTFARLNSEPILDYGEPKPVIPELEINSETPFSLNDIHKVKSEIPILEPVITKAESKPVTPELGVIPEAPVLPSLSLNNVAYINENDVKKKESVIKQEPTSVFPTISEISARPIQEPIINNVEPKTTPEIGAIPEAPVLPPLSLNNVPSIIEDDVKKEKSKILENPTNEFPTISEISARPMQEPIINNVEPKTTPELGVISEASLLHPLSLNNVPSLVQEDVKKEESVIKEEPMSVFPTISEISARPMQESKPVTPELGVFPEAPVLPPLSLSNIPSLVQEDVKKEESVIKEEPMSLFPTISEISARPIQEPVINNVEPTPSTPELGAIPEAPILPPLSLSNIPSLVQEDVKKEESVIKEEPTSVFPTISKISDGPMQEPVITYVEPKPVAPELGAIPEAPVLPPLSLNNVPSIIEDDVKKEKSKISEEPTSEFPTISKISDGPMQEPVINYVEPKPVTPKLGAILEAPELPPLSLNDVPSIIEDDVKKEKSKISEEPTSEFPTISKISDGPMQEPVINYVGPKPMTPKLGAIPEAPVLPPLSLNNVPSIIKDDVKKEKSKILEEPTSEFPTISKISDGPMQEPVINYVEPKPVTPKLGANPEAPELPPLSLNDVPSIIEDDVKKEKSKISEEPTSEFPTISKISDGPMQEPVINYVEPKPVTPKLGAIPEAPELPPLSLNNVPSIIEDDVKKEKSKISKEPTSEFPTVSKISDGPMQEPVINYVEPKPVTPKLGAIPEAPELPPLSLNNVPSIIEDDVKKEKSKISEEPTSEFPTISKISDGPMQEPVITYVEPKPVAPELGAIPEAPELPPLSLNNVPSIIEDDVKKEKSKISEEPTSDFPTISKISDGPMQEPVINYVEPKPVTPKLGAIPEAPELPPLSLNNVPSIIEDDVKKEKSKISEEPTSEFPTVSKISDGPMQEPVITYVEPKPVTPKLGAIPEAPELPPLSLNNVPSIIEDDVKKEKSKISEEPTSEFPTISKISDGPMQEPVITYVEPKPVTPELGAIPEAPELPPLSLNNVPSIIEDDVKKEKSKISEEPTSEFPTISKISDGPMQEPVINYVEPKPVTPKLGAIPEAPKLPPLSLNNVPSIIEDDVKKEKSKISEEPTSEFPTVSKISDGTMQKPVINYVEPKPVTPKLGAIPEAPELPPLSLNNVPSIIEDDVKKEKSKISEEPMSEFPTISKISDGPMQEPVITYVEPKPVTPELGAIPEAPELPPLSLNNVPSIIEDDVKKEKSKISEEPTSEFPTISKISDGPMQEPVINYVEPKPVTPKLGAIPEAPELPPLSLNNVPSIIEDDVKKEKSKISEEPTSEFPTISKISDGPMQEPVINYVEPKPVTPKLGAIPEAPELPPLSLNNVPSIIEDDVKKEKSKILEEPTSVFPAISEISARPMQVPKPVTPELGVIPEAPVLPPLSLSNIPSLVQEDMKKEESVIKEEPTSVFPTISEISARPMQEPFINYVEPKPVTPELGAILEAPVLPSLSLNNVLYINENDVKKEESVIFEKPMSVFSTISEISARPIQESVINYVELKPVTPEIGAIPETPVLPSLSQNNIASDIEQGVKRQESIILDKPMNLFSTIGEISVSPMQKPINYVGLKPVTGLLDISKAPVLPPLSLNGVHVVKEKAKGANSLLETIEVKPKQASPELVAILKAPVVSQLSLTNILSDVNKNLKKEETIKKGSINVYPTFPEISMRPTQEPFVNNVELKPVISDLGAIPEGSVLPHFSLNDIHVIKNKVNNEELITLEDYTDVFAKIPEITIRPTSESSMFEIKSKPATSGLVVLPETPGLPPQAQPYFGIPPIFEEGKIQESLKVKESTSVYSAIPKISAVLEPSVESETAVSFSFENKNFPKEGKIEVLLGESAEEFSPNTEIFSGVTFQEPEITNSYVWEEISRPNPFTESVITIRKTLPSAIIPKTSNNQAVFSYGPFVSHFTNRAPYSKPLMNPKPASLQSFLVMEHPFGFSEMPNQKLSPSISRYNEQFILPTSYAHDIIEKRIVPNMAFKNNALNPKLVKIVIRPNVPRGKLIVMPS